MNIRMTDEMRAELEAIAEAERRSVSNLIVTMIEKCLQERQKPVDAHREETQK
jgi:predicted transcriptional regulator